MRDYKGQFTLIVRDVSAMSLRLIAYRFLNTLIESLQKGLQWVSVDAASTLMLSVNVPWQHVSWLVVGLWDIKFNSKIRIFLRPKRRTRYRFHSHWVKNGPQWWLNNGFWAASISMKYFVLTRFAWTNPKISLWYSRLHFSQE